MQAEVERLQREQFGTPCKCEEWVKACGLAEARAEQVEAALLRYVERDHDEAIRAEEERDRAYRTHGPWCRCENCMKLWPTAWKMPARAERAEAALREIEETTEGIPEANCALANRIARVALAEVNPADDPAADLQAMGAPAEEPKP